jgi:hypothetical protein
MKTLSPTGIFGHGIDDDMTIKSISKNANERNMEEDGTNASAFEKLFHHDLFFPYCMVNHTMEQRNELLIAPCKWNLAFSKIYYFYFD